MASADGARAELERSWSRDLVWWRATDGWSTLVSLSHTWLRPTGAAVPLLLTLRDPGGEVVARTRRTFDPARPLFISSADEDLPAHDGTLELRIEDVPRSPSPGRGSLYPFVDWLHEDGAFATIHSDHVPGTRFVDVELTEIVVDETAEQRNSLVITNGPTPRPAGSVTLTVENARGEKRTADDGAALAPFALHRIELAQLFPELAAFADGAPLAVTGTLRLGGHWCRPIVVCDGPRFAAFHGGDLYTEMVPVPRLEYLMLGRGWVNPMLVAVEPGLSTEVDLLNSHGDLEVDVDIDLRLYDEGGALVVEVPRWAHVRRGGFVRRDFTDVVPAASVPFRGHAALSFADNGDELLPRVLQGLFRYRSAPTTARAMVWSDEWNSPQRRYRAGGAEYLALARVRSGGPLRTEVTVTNCGVPDSSGEYRETAPFTATWTAPDGTSATQSGEIPPHGTVTLAPAADLVRAHPLLHLEVASTSDLALVQLTHHAGTGAVAVEHAMAGRTLVDGEELYPAGF
jgi:hypothetical protein